VKVGKANERRGTQIAIEALESGKSRLVDQESLMKEVKELTAIFAASRITARENKMAMKNKLGHQS
jgi:hypothetical protein